jgi:hypothetical protein
VACGVTLIDQREAKMAGLTGLFQRGSSYYIRVVLPLSHPLRNTFKNGKLVKLLNATCAVRRRFSVASAEIFFLLIVEQILCP